MTCGVTSHGHLFRALVSDHKHMSSACNHCVLMALTDWSQWACLKGCNDVVVIDTEAAYLPTSWPSVIQMLSILKKGGGKINFIGTLSFSTV